MESRIKKNVKVNYSLPVISYLDGTFTHIDNDGITQEKLKSLGTLRGFTVEAYQQAITSNKIRIAYFSRADLLIAALLAKRIDAIYLNKETIEQEVAKLSVSKRKQITYQASLPHVQGHYYLSSINQPALIKQFNQFLLQYKKQ